MIQHLWREGFLSRSELTGRMGLSANSVGTLANGLIRMGVLAEQTPRPSNGGRPRVPLGLDATRCEVVGLSIRPGLVGAARLNLAGNLVGRGIQKKISDPAKLTAAAASLIEPIIGPETLSVGLAAPGFVDPKARAILYSAAGDGRGSISLAALEKVVGKRPLLIENDMHALSARWLLTHRAVEAEDVLLVYINDGSVGAAVMIDGRPNRGSVRGGNELGHMRFPVETDACYCGQKGCLERICSSRFLAAGGCDQTLLEAAEGVGDSMHRRMEELMNHLSAGIANAANFIRPHRLVLVSPMIRFPAFTSELTRMIRTRLLQELTDRVRLELWDRPVGSLAETAGWLAIAGLFCDGWLPEETV
ncbi:MAG: ROK family protein [Phycisphaeraceae bacterium]|nr:ROK family protein [Phycisphaeraceae bacterium]